MADTTASLTAKNISSAQSSSWAYKGARVMTLHKALILVTLAACVGPTSSAQLEVREIRFAAGKISATVSDAVVRGQRHLWSFDARAGQRATVTVTAPENNAVFQIWQPGARVKAGAFLEVEGEALPGAAEGHDARRWEGRLPLTGSYLVIVGPSRGNAEYRLTVTLPP
jgi:hypothetical protein